MLREYGKIPECDVENTPFTIFVIQSKLAYLNTNENKFLMNVIFPQMAAVAEEEDFVSI